MSADGLNPGQRKAWVARAECGHIVAAYAGEHDYARRWVEEGARPGWTFEVIPSQQVRDERFCTCRSDDWRAPLAEAWHRTFGSVKCHMAAVCPVCGHTNWPAASWTTPEPTK